MRTGGGPVESYAVLTHAKDWRINNCRNVADPEYRVPRLRESCDSFAERKATLIDSPALSMRIDALVPLYDGSVVVLQERNGVSFIYIRWKTPGVECFLIGARQPRRSQPVQVS